MTFDVDDILKQLEAGTNVNDIATAAANAINDALKLQEIKKLEAEKQKKNKVVEEKIADAGYLIEEIIEFLNQYYPELLDGKEEIPDAKIRGLAKDLIDIFDKAYDDTLKIMGDDNIQKFLKENKLI